MAYEFDAAKHEYMVLVVEKDEKTERISVPAGKLALAAEPISEAAREQAARDPFVPYIRTDGMEVRCCANPGCEFMSLAMGETKREIKRSQRRQLKPCARCHDAVYCSKECQIAHWPIHKKLCKVAGLMRNVEKALDRAGSKNKLFCDLSDLATSQGMEARKVLMLRCPETKHLKLLAEQDYIKSKHGPYWHYSLATTAALEEEHGIRIEFEPLSDLSIKVRAMQNEPGDNTIYQTLLQQVQVYDLNTQVSICTLYARPDGQFAIRPFLIRRRTG